MLNSQIKWIDSEQNEINDEFLTICEFSFYHN